MPAMRSAPAPLAPAQPGTALRPPRRSDAGVGVTAACTIASAWVITLVLSLAGPQPLWLIPLIVALRTFLSTGLFITAHDAMHGLVDPSRPRLNHLVGTVAVLLYAGFGYRGLLEAHHLHHAAPGTAEDPDFHRGDPRLLPWFFSFMRRYTTVGQLLTLTVFFQICVHLLDVSVGAMLLYWALPALLSAVQLWYFGTWRPHHPRAEGFADEHRAAGERWPAWATFLSCYHFGLHHTHHLAPWVPWWRLPAAERAIARP
jgi:beta-carotene/zeaxanthin 4-ketolase